jgi:hypothetical protein
VKAFSLAVSTTVPVGLLGLQMYMSEVLLSTFFSMASRSSLYSDVRGTFTQVALNSSAPRGRLA